LIGRFLHSIGMSGKGYTQEIGPGRLNLKGILASDFNVVLVGGAHPTSPAV